MNAPSHPQPLPDVPDRETLFAPYQFEALRGDPRLTSLTDFVAQLCGAPTALVSLVDDHRQIFLARTGSAAPEPPFENSFCAQAMLCDEVMLVLDASIDPRFAANPLVTGDPGIRFYAGAPLRTAEGAPLGSLCVIDTVAHVELTDLQRRGLETMASAVMTLFEANRGLIAKEAQTSEARGERDERTQRFATLADTMPQMVWSTLPDGFHDYFNARWYEFTGMPPGSTDGEGWNGMFHPDDQDRAWEKWRHSLATGEPYEIEYRLRDRHGDYRWVLGRALPMRDSKGVVTRWFGTCTDIHEQKVSLEQRELISHELSHRIKNIFSVISGLIALSARVRPELKPAADELRDRVVALGAAHDFVRPHSEASRPRSDQTSLHGMLEQLLAPYQSGDEQRFRFDGPDVEIDDRSATPLALLFHELATNAAKYGALSRAEGMVTISTAVEDETAKVRWRELRGPSVGEPSAEGFGSRLIEMSVRQQLGGGIERIWHKDGLEARISIPCRSMRRVNSSS
ncbi:MAG: PAS domain-containing protein [Sphingomicrobium sp.]